eukprot:767874-Hanusia_phi.AAC.2
MKETLLAKRFIEALALNHKCEDAQRLQCWKQPIAGEGMGDFSLVLESVLKSRTESNEEGRITLADVVEFLEQLSVETQIHGRQAQKDSKKQAGLLAGLLMQASATEIRWIARVILRELKAGLSERLVLNALHPDAMNFFKINANLREVVNQCKDPKVRLNKINIDYFQPFNPMLAEKVSELQAVPVYFHNRPFWIEDKFDGERIQIHKKDNEFRCYTRRGNDYTKLYHPLLDILREEKLIRVENCILDGEVVGWNFDDKKWEKFGTNRTIALKMGNRAGEDGEELYQMTSSDFASNGASRGKTLCFVAFDLVREGDTVMTEWPLRERRQRLQDIVKEKDKIFEVVKHVEASESGEVSKRLEKAVEEDGEGIILKNPESKYVPKSREKGEWMKLKPDYLGGAEDFDVLIVGGSYGKGSHAGQVWQFICAIADDVRKENEKPKCFRTMCRVGTGTTQEEFRMLSLLLQEGMRPFKRLAQGKSATDRGVKFERKQDFTSVQWEQDGDSPAVEVLFSGNPKEQGQADVVYDPRKSVVLTLAADYRLIESNVFMAARGMKEGIMDDKTGWTLRFPRIREYRCGEMGGNEKPWEDCMTLKEFERVIDRSQKADLLNNLQDNKSGIGDRKRKLGQQTGRRTRGAAQMIGDAEFTGNNYEAKYDVLKGMEICVLPGDPEHKRETERQAKELGATLVANIDSLTTHIIGMRQDQRFKNLKLDDVDVIGRHWVSECYEKKRLVELAPRHMMHISCARKKEFRSLYDKFGDSYTEVCNEQELTMLLDEPQDPEVRRMALAGCF